MLSILKKIEKDLPSLLELHPDNWESKHIVYEKPHVDRVWRQHGELRIFLHRIWPCEKEESFWHTHNWPCAVKICDGSVYEHAVGHNADLGENSGFYKDMLSLLTPGSCYEMTKHDLWHRVRPIGSPVFSLMVIGKPYPHPIKTEKPPPQSDLTPTAKIEILRKFRDFYPNSQTNFGFF